MENTACRRGSASADAYRIRMSLRILALTVGLGGILTSSECRLTEFQLDGFEIPYKLFALIFGIDADRRHGPRYKRRSRSRSPYV
jgi:hypothetical protein